MGLFDQITLLLIGLVAIYIISKFYLDFKNASEKAAHDIYYMVGFTVLLVAGLLMIFLGFDVLANPLVVVVAAIIPFALSVGLISEFYPKFEKVYLIFTLIGIVLILLTRTAESSILSTLVLAVFHSVAGFTIFFVPILASKNKKTTNQFIWVTVGGTLIGIGGIALAFLKAGSPILSKELIFTILTPLLFLMAVSFAFGFVKKMDYQK
ncbi:MAG: hypothetical protein AB7T22_14680 [Calditrichaceae bacterium]